MSHVDLSEEDAIKLSQKELNEKVKLNESLRGSEQGKGPIIILGPTGVGKTDLID